MAKWEYRVEFIENGFQQKLNELGFNGWELVSSENLMVINKTMFTFKRPLPIDAPSKQEVDAWFKKEFPHLDSSPIEVKNPNQ